VSLSMVPSFPSQKSFVFPSPSHYLTKFEGGVVHVCDSTVLNIETIGNGVKLKSSANVRIIEGIFPDKSFFMINSIFLDR